MSKIKKVVAMLLALTMVLGMGMTAFAANGKPESTDTIEVNISGITEGAQVTLYQIASGKYQESGVQLIGYNWIEANLFTEVTDEATKVKTVQPTANEIVEVGYRLQGKTVEGKQPLTAMSTFGPDTVGADGKYTKSVTAGAYIAIISHDDEVYNPVLLSATYGAEGNLTTETVNVTDGYLYGTNAVAKKTTPDVEKEVTGGTADETKQDEEGNPIQTASVGDVLTYTVTPTMPQYPVNALNKTFYIADRMTAGLTFIADSIQIAIDGEVITGVANEEGIYTFTNNAGTVIARAKSESLDGMNGFNLSFDYEKLQDSTSGAVATPVVTYKAVVNENAVVGQEGNNNDVDMFYAKDPSTGSTWDNLNETPEGADGVEKKEDKKIVYTYQVSFKKVQEDGQTPLAGAIFGIYDEAGKLVDQVTTNDEGYAVSTNVSAVTYTIKELVAPTGYTLNTNTYKVTAEWTSATYEVTETVTDRTYTTEAPSKDAVQVGWIADSVFYVNESDAPEGAKPAYLESTNTTTVTDGGTVVNDKAGAGTVLLGENIPNTKLTSLPSTGGIGTTIFTIGGCLIMIAAAGLFFASRRKSAK